MAQCNIKAAAGWSGRLDGRTAARKGRDKMAGFEAHINKNGKNTGNPVTASLDGELTAIFNVCMPAGTHMMVECNVYQRIDGKIRFSVSFPNGLTTVAVLDDFGGLCGYKG